MLTVRLKILRWLEIVFLFIGIPILLRYDVLPKYKLLPLLLISVIYFYMLWKDKSFKRRRFRLNQFQAWSTIWWRIAIMFFFLVLFTWVFFKEQFLDLITKNPKLWITIVLMYPLFSVLPQELIFRAYFYHRFTGLIGNRNYLIMLNALLFSFSHIMYGNWVALVLTFVAGIMFSLTYLRYRSLLIVMLEHSIYGLMVFTFGPAQFFHSF